MITGSFLLLGDDGTGFTGTAPPVYLMTEPIVEVIGTPTYWYLDNSSNTGAVYDGRLEHSSQSTDGIEGDPWQPSIGPNGQYNSLGVIDLGVNGNATRQINTQWTPPSNTAWTILGTYNITLGVSYSSYAIHYDGIDSVNVYLWNSGEAVPVSPTHSNIPYTPQITPWVLNTSMPDVIDINNIIYKMDSFTTV